MTIDDAQIILLTKELMELRTFEASRSINSNVDREIIQRMIRLVEILTVGAATTQVPPRHHA